MAERNYGQYCGLAHAADLVTERWALLIIRELLVGAATYGGLKDALPRIPTNVLATRLKELEAGGVVERRVEPGRRGVRYALTDYGRELDPIVLALGGWGARTMGDPRPGDTVSPGSICMALRTTFHKGQHRAETAELRLPGFTVSTAVSSEFTRPTAGPATSPDIVLTLDPGQLKGLLDGSLPPLVAVEAGVSDDADGVARFVAAHHIGA